MSRKKKKEEKIKAEETIHQAEEDSNRMEKQEQLVDIEESAATGKKETAEDRILTLEREKEDAVGKYLRLLAEFENYRKRNEKERINWIRNATEKLSLKICDIIDDFERALQAKPDDRETDQFLKGIESIYKKLENVINAEGVQKIEALGKEFDPMYHEAVSYIPAEEKADTVISVIQNGYIMHNRVIRAAKVAVSAGNDDDAEITEE